jgi:hypothetical protein
MAEDVVDHAPVGITNQQEMKLIIAGSREFTDAIFLENVIPHRINVKDIEEVVSGGARGVDQLGEAFAKKHGIPIKPFYVTKADWNTYGAAAGPMRNGRMADYADAAIIFWDGKRSMINHMKRRKKPYQVIEVHVK